QRGPDEYSATASPATCVLIGLTGIQAPEHPFDLVVSGINQGANVGSATGISGTVGATTIAITVGGVPAIAFSANNIGEGPEDEGFSDHLREVAAYSAQLVDRLNSRREPDGGLLPPGTALNVNFPAIRVGQTKGLHFGVQGKGSPFALRFEEKSPGVFAPAFARAKSRADVAGSDAEALAQGHVTVVLLDGDYTAPASAREKVKGRLDPPSPSAP
ncbi:hypothetical protein MK489_09610, partial [Myxococcota bacterium]|nr:hypothetical protein [Myxococcota bacterium]